MLLKIYHQNYEIMKAIKDKKVEDDKDIEIEEQGYVYFWQNKDINHAFNNSEIEIIAKDK